LRRDATAVAVLSGCLNKNISPQRIAERVFLL